MFANAKKGALFIDCSTIDPIASKELCAEAKKMGLNMIDAPVSGGVTGIVPTEVKEEKKKKANGFFDLLISLNCN